MFILDEVYLITMKDEERKKTYQFIEEFYKPKKTRNVNIKKAKNLFQIGLLKKYDRWSVGPTRAGKSTTAIKISILSNYQIHEACWVDEVDQFTRGLHHPDEFITDRFVWFNFCDRSEMAQLNMEWKDGSLEIIEPIPANETRDYTHIVRGSNCHYFAVVFKEGDWTETFFNS